MPPIPTFIFRIVSWILAIGALLATVAAFTSLPERLPISRWQLEKKTLFLALRIPLINLTSLAIIEVLGRAMSREQWSSKTQRIVPILSITAGFKAAFEGSELLLLPRTTSILTALTATTVLVGLLLSLSYGKELFKNNNWKRLKPTLTEKISLGFLAAIILTLNMPIFLRMVSI